MIFGQVIDCMLAGMSVGFEAFLVALGIRNAIDGIKEQMMASFLGVPVWLIHLISLLITVSGLVWLIVKRLRRNI